MSDAGKPIYSRHGDEEILSPFIATISACMTKFQSYFVLVAEREQKNRLRWISSKFFDCAILRKGNLIYICIVNNTLELKNGQEFIDEKYQK